MRGARSRRPTRLLLAIGLAALVLTGAGDGTEPRIVAIDPSRTGDLVVCRLTTSALPGERLLQSMRSGLVSAVDFDVALIDRGENPVRQGRLTLQLAFDLWEDVFAVRGGSSEQRFADLAALRAYLSELKEVPVAPVTLLRPGQRYRVRVGMRLHPIAPSQRQSVEAAITGDVRPDRPGEEQQELSISLGRLIHFFYGREDEPARGEAQSPWFTLEELSRAPD